MGKKTGRPRGRPKTRDTEHTSLRIDAEAAFALELLRNHHRLRPKISIMEEAIKMLADRDLRYGTNKDIRWQELYHPSPAVRHLLKLMVEGYIPSAEEVVLQKFLRQHWWLFFFDDACRSPRPPQTILLEPKLAHYVEKWREAGGEDISDTLVKDLKAADIPVPKRS